MSKGTGSLQVNFLIDGNSGKHNVAVIILFCLFGQLPLIIDG